MKYAEKSAVKVVAANTPEEFELKLNTVLTDISGCKHEIVFNLNAGFCAYITYKMSAYIPECVMDEYELDGIRFSCADCPNYVRSFDGRVKYTRCQRGERCHADKAACEWFYEELDEGRISPKSDEESAVA